jgi:hypothetical protein
MEEVTMTMYAGRVTSVSSLCVAATTRLPKPRAVAAKSPAHQWERPGGAITNTGISTR